MSEILFFRTDNISAADRDEDSAAPAGLEVWQPSPFELKPRGISYLPYTVWWSFHYCGLFKSDRYRIFLVRRGGAVVHRSCVFPPFFRFPFMAPGDLQAGDIWTDPAHRGKGLAVSTLRRIVLEHPQARVWFLCASSNTASANLAKRAGMNLHGVGRRESRFGVGLLGRFVMDSRPDAPAS